jgi:hypothetical protein
VPVPGVASYYLVAPVLRVSLSLYHIKSLLRHASTTVTRSLAATVSVCLVLLKVLQPAVGYTVRVTPSPRMFIV